MTEDSTNFEVINIKMTKFIKWFIMYYLMRCSLQDQTCLKFWGINDLTAFEKYAWKNEGSSVFKAIGVPAHPGTAQETIAESFGGRLCKLDRYLATRKDFNYLCHLKSQELQIYIDIHENKFNTTRVNIT